MLNPKFTYKVYNNLLIALAFLIPIHDRLVAPVIALLGLFWFLEFNFIEKWKQLKSSKNNRYLLAFASIYLVYLAGTIYSEQLTGMTGAWFTLEVKMSLFVFPLWFSTTNVSQLRPDIYKKIIVSFIWGSFISGMLILNNAVYQYFMEKSTSVFFYTKLSMVHHPSYLSLIYTFDIALLVNWLFIKKPKNPTKRNAAYVLILFFQFLIILLSSKAGIISVVLMFVIVMIFTVLKDRASMKGHFLVAGSLMIIFLFILFLTPPSYNRFFAAERALESKLQADTNHLDGSVARMLIWKSALEIIADNPVLGVGTGDVTTELLNKYHEHNIVMAEEREYNAHNQYLQTYVATGIAGFLALMGCLFAGAFVAFTRKNLLYLVFVLVFAFNILVESMLERQAGVVFYSFFNALLFYFTINKKKS